MLGKYLNISETTFLLKNGYSSHGFYKISSHSRCLMVIIFKIFTFYFIYLAVPGLSCSTWGSLIFFAACTIFSFSMWDLVPLSGIKPRASELGTQSLSHWTIREVPTIFIYTPKIDYSRQISFIACPRFPQSSVGKEATCNVRDLSSIPGLGRSSGEGISYPLQYSWASIVAQLVKNVPAMWEIRF